MLGVYVAGDSGGFLNPAVTLCFCTFRELPWRRFPIYLIAQFLGGFCASGVVYANYINAINSVEGYGNRTVPPSKTATAGIFATYPQPFMTKTSEFFSEFIASTILMFVIFALKDDSNPGAMGKSGMGPLFPLALLFLVFGLGACFGFVKPLPFCLLRVKTNGEETGGKQATQLTLREISDHASCPSVWATAMKSGAQAASTFGSL
jgi:aquaglyceroporin related protein